MTAHADLSPTLQLACELIRRPSVTPLDADCQKLMMQRLGDGTKALSQAVESFNGGCAVATSILVRDAGHWRFFARHASPLIEPEDA